MFFFLIDWDAAIYAQQLFNDLVPADKENIMLADMYLQVYVQMLLLFATIQRCSVLIFFGFLPNGFIQFLGLT
jgi:hypothetical protein